MRAFVMTLLLRHRRLTALSAFSSVRYIIFDFRGKSMCVCSSFAGARSPWCGDVWKNPLARNMLLKLLTQRNCQQEVRHRIQQFTGTYSADCVFSSVHWGEEKNRLLWLSYQVGPHEIIVVLLLLSARAYLPLCVLQTTLSKATSKVYVFLISVCVSTTFKLRKNHRLMFPYLLKVQIFQSWQ